MFILQAVDKEKKCFSLAGMQRLFMFKAVDKSSLA